MIHSSVNIDDMGDIFIPWMIHKKVNIADALFFDSLYRSVNIDDREDIFLLWMIHKNVNIDDGEDIFILWFTI